MENAVMSRTALGRIASVGDLYDMRTDNFCGISIFKKAIPSTTLTILDSNFTDLQIITSDTYSEKFLRMDISAELSVSLLAGKIALEGSGKFLYDKTNTSRIAKCSLVYKIQTKDEKLNINHEDLRMALSTDAIQDDSATHILTGISWGAALVISCTYENKDNKLLQDAQGKLSAKVKWLAASLSGDALFKDGDNEKDMKFEIRIFGDVLPEHGELPLTFEGALDLMKQLPKLVSNCNTGKGKPLVYRFLPISKLRGYLNLEIKIDSILISLEDSALSQIVDLFDELAESKQELNDFQQEVTVHRYWLKKQETDMISKYIRNVSRGEATMKSNLSQVLISVRSGKIPISGITDFITKFYTSDIAPDNIASTINSWRPLQKRVTFADRLVTQGAIYIGHNQSLDDLLPFDKPEAISFVLYFSHASQLVNQSCWKRNYSLFVNKMKNKTAQEPQSTFYALDCELHDIPLPEDISSCVKVYKGDECTVEDLQEDEKQNAKQPPADGASSELQNSEHNENERGDIRIQPTFRALPSALSAMLKSPLKNQHHAIFCSSSSKPTFGQDPNSLDPDYIPLFFGSVERDGEKFSPWEKLRDKLNELKTICYTGSEDIRVGMSLTNLINVHHYSSTLWMLRRPENSDLLKPTLILKLENSFRLRDILPIIVEYAIQLPNLLVEPIPYLKRGQSKTIYVTRRLACSLLAHCFLCIVPHKGRPDEMPTFHFLNLFHTNDGGWLNRTQVKVEKLKCILDYFHQMGNISSEEGDKIISFERRCIPERVDWASSSINLCNFSCNTNSGIETAKEMLQVDFANKRVGGGILSDCLFMEERRFLICPELIVSRLFTEPLQDDEVLIVTGTKQFTTYSGRGPNFRFVSRVNTPPPEKDSFGRECCQVVEMDALQFSKHRDRAQFEKRNIDRELHKCYVGFSAAPFVWSDLPPVATGNWGCGVFNGDKELKILLQWMAASEVGRPSIVFHTGLVEQSKGIMELGSILKTREVRVGQLYKVLLDYEKNYDSHLPFKFVQSNPNPNYGRLFHFIRDKI